MTNAPTVTIVIPTFNTARWLAEAVDSALAQTFTDIEVLVFDNASTDDTPQIMARYADPRCTYVRAAVNVGMAGNITRGITAARGRYFLVLGADDVLEPAFVARAVARMDAAPGASVIHGPAIWIDDDGQPIGLSSYDWPAHCPGDAGFPRVFTEGFCYSTVLSRMGPVKALGAMDEDWGMISDSWLLLKLCLQGDVLFLDEPLVRYRVRESSLSFELYADGRMFNDHLAGLDAAFSWPDAVHLAPHKTAARVAVAQQALDTLHMTRIGSGRGAAWRKAMQVVRAEPRVLRNPRAWARIAFAMLPEAAIQALRARKRRAEMARTARLARG